jgi:endonuclease YncB( thermonuclease family)
MISPIFADSVERMTNVIPMRPKRRPSKGPRRAKAAGLRGATPLVLGLIATLVGCSVALAPDNRPTAQATGGQPGRIIIDDVTRVRDGDTLVVGLVPVRIANLDCAERGTPEGDAASTYVRQLVDGAQIRCSLEGRMSYDRGRVLRSLAVRWLLSAHCGQSPKPSIAA